MYIAPWMFETIRKPAIPLSDDDCRRLNDATSPAAKAEAAATIVDARSEEALARLPLREQLDLIDILTPGGTTPDTLNDSRVRLLQGIFYDAPIADGFFRRDTRAISNICRIGAQEAKQGWKDASLTEREGYLKTLLREYSWRVDYILPTAHVSLAHMPVDGKTGALKLYDIVEHANGSREIRFNTHPDGVLGDYRQSLYTLIDAATRLYQAGLVNRMESVRQKEHWMDSGTGWILRMHLDGSTVIAEQGEDRYDALRLLRLSLNEAKKPNNGLSDLDLLSTRHLRHNAWLAYQLEHPVKHVLHELVASTPKSVKRVVSYETPTRKPSSPV